MASVTQDEVNALRDHNRERWTKMLARGYMPAEPMQVLAATIDCLAGVLFENDDEGRILFEYRVELAMKSLLDAGEPQMDHLDAVKRLQVTQQERKQIILP